MKSNSTIRFFNRGEYYTCHGSDALFVALEVYKTSSVCKQLGVEPNKLDGVSLNKSRFESLVRDLLLIKQYRVEVYIDTGVGRNRNWTLEYKGSPGNLSEFEDLLFGNTEIVDSGLIMGIKLATDGKSKIVGLSCIDQISSIIYVSQFVDDESFSNLQALIITIAPKECLLSQNENSIEFQKMKEIIERNNIMITLRKKIEFSTDSVFQDLTSLIKFKKGQQENIRALPETDLEHAMSATAAIIKFLDLTSDNRNENQFKFEEIIQSRYLRLDVSAIKALNIEPPPGEPLNGIVRGAPTSIHGLFNKCQTPQGHRLMAQWIRRPLHDLALIKERHDIVEVIVKNSDLRSTITEDYLKRVPDMEQLAKKLLQKKARLVDCYKIYLAVNSLPGLVKALAIDDAPAALRVLIIEPLTECIQDMDKYQEMIENTLDMNALESKEYRVKPEFNDDLVELNEQLESLKAKMDAQLLKVAKDTDMEPGKKIKLENNSHHGYYFRVTLKDEKTLRKNKEYTVFESSKNGIKFRNKRLEDYNNEYLEKKQKYEEEQSAIVAEIINVAASYTGAMKNIASAIAILDVLNCFAIVTTAAPKMYVRPEMLPSEAGVLNLTQARHPFVEIQSDIQYIPNDISFKKKDTQFHIITGPNMGGKSTHMKVAGVCVLLAHIGCFVPCDKAEMSLHDSILARVGADDSQVKGVSTFQAEMIEVTTILKTVTNNSLVLIDELGRGTSTYDGCALAWSIAEHLAKNSEAFCFFATHYHEITRLADDLPTVKNYHVGAITNDDNVIFLYSVKPGICEESYGIFIAKMANFPDDVIKYAKCKQAELEDGQIVPLKKINENLEESKNIVLKGEELIEKFVNACKTLHKSSANAEEEIIKLKNEILSQNNSYINYLIG
ncbi:hypothetical protein PV325_002411 [Microctonus aethiopoides]|nr:hypothetical protein PV325_002411 [Microctonus aethiopoides]